MLAVDLVAALRSGGHSVVAVARTDLDITDTQRVEAAVERARPDVVFNCAAYNDVDRAESEPDVADAVNGSGVRNLCLACRRSGALLVHFSSDYVFDGRRQGAYRVGDDPAPINEYGRSKLLGERFARELWPRTCLLRSSWLFGLAGENFVERILAKATRGEPLAVVDDARGCPTWTVDLAGVAVELAERDVRGVFHATNRGATTWYDFAREILLRTGLRVTLARTTARALGRPAKRPANSELDPEPLPRVLGRELRPWQEALGEYLRRRGTGGRPGP